MASNLKFGTTLRNQLVTSMGTPWNSGSLFIYDGAPPADPQTAPSGNLLTTIVLPNPAFGSAANGVISKDGTWSGTVSQGGTAGWFRMTASGVDMDLDGTAGISTDTPDLVLDNKVLIQGGTVTVTSFTFTQPE